MKINLPNRITIVRIVLIPLVVFFYLANFIPNGIGKFISCFIFILAALTDFLDGSIARKTNQVTNLGKFLDPIADKLLVISALILVCVDHTVPAIFAEIVLIIMIGRDFIVGAIRQVGATKNVVISADIYGKIKTILQDIALSALIILSGLNNLNLSGLAYDIFKYFSFGLIALATLASIMSGINYCIKNKGVLE